MTQFIEKVMQRQFERLAKDLMGALNPSQDNSHTQVNCYTGDTYFLLEHFDKLAVFKTYFPHNNPREVILHFNLKQSNIIHIRRSRPRKPLVTPQ